MTTTSHWHKSAPNTQHKTVKSHEIRKEVKTFGPDTPDLSKLQPGESVSFTGSTRPAEESWTNDDKLTFTNGGAIEDKNGEGGLLITTPDGETHETPGWIDIDRLSGQPTVNFMTKDQWDDRVHWTQTFPENGGTVVTKEGDHGEDVVVTAGPNGTLSAIEDGMGDKVEARREGAAMVFKDPFGDYTAVSPPVPLNWVVAG